MSLSGQWHVLHYVGYDHLRGGIVAAVNALADCGLFVSELGLSAQPTEGPAGTLPVSLWPRMDGDRISPAGFFRAPKVAQAVRAWLLGDEHRLFHGHSRAGLLVGLCLASDREVGARVRVTVHAQGRQRWFYRWAKARLGDRMAWVSPQMARYYGCPGVGWGDCTPPALTTTGPENARSRQLANDEQVVRIGMAGALVPVKEWEVVLDALGRISPRVRERVEVRHFGGEDADLVSKEYAQSLRERVEALKLGGIVQFEGPQPSIDPLLASSELWVCPSSREALGLTAMEALRAGVPVIYAQGGGAEEFFREGANGWLFRGGDSAALADVLKDRIQRRDAPLMPIDDRVWRRFEPAAVARQWRRFYDLPCDYV